jgi:uncharacterized Tic20 family protein
VSAVFAVVPNTDPQKSQIDIVHETQWHSPPFANSIVEPTHTERSTAALMHVSSLFAPILAPAAVYVISRKKSEFVAAHSLRAIKEWLVLNVSLLVVGAVSLSYTIYRLIDLYNKNWEGFSIWEFLLRFLIGYILLSILGFFMAIITIGQALQAYKGRWPKSRALAIK